MDTQVEDYLKGQVGAWAPLQPQWQHWGAPWLTHEWSPETECVETGVVAGVGDGGWLAVVDEECASTRTGVEDEENMVVMVARVR